MIARLAVVAALILAVFGPARSVAAADLAFPPAHHAVHAVLDVPGHRITVIDEVRLVRAPEAGEPWRFLLHSALEPTTARLGTGGPELAIEILERWNPRHFWKRPPYAELGNWDVAREIELAAPRGGWGATGPTIILEYAGVVADSLHRPERAYGRSFETTTGRIVDQGAFLAGGTFWLPWAGDAPASFDLTVEGPAGWRTVSQGRLVEDDVTGDRRTMRWSCEHPMEEVYLIAGPYEMHEVDHRGLSIQAFCYESTGAEIVDRYLEATGPILDEYDMLLGPYPFSKFALVENYWQTGYGMPSFTFLGDRVIRLPFILYTSYPHEILHNWWGNGVYVAYERGNWCEGLTTYLADYRSKERESEKAARDYRRNTLVGYRDFATTGGRDFALVKFRSRDSAATEAVGYGKTLMVYHMLRDRVGDRAFYAALRRFYEDNLFRRADWEDIRKSFEAETGDDLGPWFAQWVQRPGAIRLSLSGVETQASPATGAPTAWVTTGVLTQEAPVFDAPISVRVVGPSGEEGVEAFRSVEETTRFEIRTPFRPLTVSADPAYDLFRVLHAEEVAPTLSGVLGAERTRIVIGAGVEGELRDALLELAEDWAADSTISMLEEKAGLEIGDFEGGTWYFGAGPAAERFRSTLPEAEGEASADGLSRVDVGRIDGRLDRPAALLWPASVEVVPALGRKVPHYSKYSFLRFDGERNVAKGQWDAGESPMTVRLPAPGTEPDPAESGKKEE